MVGRQTDDEWWNGRLASARFLACLIVFGLFFPARFAAAQESRPQPAAEQKQDDPGFFNRVGRWFDRQFDNAKSGLNVAKDGVDDFNRQAGNAAKTTASAAAGAARTTVDAAKDAADAVARLPSARVISGHAVCVRAPNGAEDCAAAAESICRGKGFSTGKSFDTTTAENCPARVMLSGRDPLPGECKLETFVSRAVCQ